MKCTGQFFPHVNIKPKTQLSVNTFFELEIKGILYNIVNFTKFVKSS